MGVGLFCWWCAAWVAAHGRSWSLVQRNPTGCVYVCEFLVCDLETLTMRRLRSELGCCAKESKYTIYTSTFAVQYFNGIRSPTTETTTGVSSKTIFSNPWPAKRMSESYGCFPAQVTCVLPSEQKISCRAVWYNSHTSLYWTVSRA